MRLPRTASKRRTFILELLTFALDPKTMAFFSFYKKDSDPVPDDYLLVPNLVGKKMFRSELF